MLGGDFHLFVIFAVLDVSLAVNLCINCSFLHLCYGSVVDQVLTFDGYAALSTDIKSEDLKAYHNFCRLCPDEYDELLHPYELLSSRK